jgi:hypothetical protein
MFHLTVLWFSEFVVPLVVIDLSYVIKYYSIQVVLSSKTGRRTMLSLKTQSVNTSQLGYKNQSVYAVSGTSTDRFI